MFPQIVGVRWFNVAVLLLTPMPAAYGLWYVPVTLKTAVFAILYYFFSMIVPCRALATGGRGATAPTTAGESAPRSLALRLPEPKLHRTDTEKDPYDASRGLLWTHIGWILFKSKLRSGPVDISDLGRDPLLRWTHRYYFPLAALFGYIVPALVPILWDDVLGGICFSAALRLTIAHHCTFAINSIAHYLGTTPYDDTLSPRDHFLSAILTMGEGYHNFHHQFPMDYRNAYLWYQWDPTKWFIQLVYYCRLASNLRIFPSNEIAKGALTMKLKQLKLDQDAIRWPTEPQDLPVVTWDTFRKESKTRSLLLISGFIHDLSEFVGDHPGGPLYLTKNAGKDMTAAFFGGVYRHSNAAHNLLSMFRVGVLAGGGCPPDQPQVVPPSQILYVAERTRDQKTS
ncbi:unnamed protein product [Mycena citricolor]|uniref:Acyl-CoA desaturase n=1 Tax=Mycena citricolor TaxID=2018698 RepID=A0AAD2Q459_9AGAR|nr:unnamed protein product [Mycena citricolor]